MAKPFKALHTEVTTDPLSRGYAGMTDAQVATSLNTKNRTINRLFVEAFEIFERINLTDLTTHVTAAAKERERQLLLLLLSQERIFIQDPNVEEIIKEVFPGAAQTKKNLVGAVGADAQWVNKDLRKIIVSRGEEINFGFVLTADVTRVRIG